MEKHNIYTLTGDCAFGITTNSDGSYSIFTRGVDRCGIGFFINFYSEFAEDSAEYAWLVNDATKDQLDAIDEFFLENGVDQENVEFSKKAIDAIINDNAEVDWFNKIILDPSFTNNPKAKGVYDKLKGLSNTIFNDIIDDHFESSKISHIKFDIGNIPDQNGYSYSGKTYASYNGSDANRFFRIRLKTSFVQDASTIEIALVIIHELIHAELLSRCIASGLILNISSNGFYTFSNYPNPENPSNLSLFNALAIYYKNLGNGNPEWNHDQFTILGYKDKIAENLMAIHPWLNSPFNPFENFIASDNVINSLNDFFNHLAWGGLQQTQAYINLSPAEKTKIEYTLQMVRSNYNHQIP